VLVLLLRLRVNAKATIETRFSNRARFIVVVNDLVGGENSELKFVGFCD